MLLAGISPDTSVDSMSLIYRDEAQRVGRLAFSMWNRDPGSPSSGSFDRAYWGWKYKDFSDSTMQYAVRLAVEYARGKGKTSTLPVLLEQFVEYCAAIQHRDGSFDQCYPNEKSPGVFYDFLSTLVYVRTSPLLESDRARGILDNVMASGVRFLLRTDEKHGEVANHIAQYAHELLNYAAHSGDERARRRGEEYVERALSWFDRDEGWFREYHGADTGYQTRTLRYLAKIALLAPDPALWRVIEQAAEFVEQTLMPDGSVHPMLGCRSSALLYASAFEALALRNERFHPLAARVRDAWTRNCVPWPSQLDFGNAIRLGEDALDAAVACLPKLDLSKLSPLSREVRFRRAGIVVKRNDTHEAYVSTHMGGAVVVYRRGDSGDWQLAGEDSGYLLKARGKTACWLTRVPGAGELVEAMSDRLVIHARFQRSLHDELTPTRMVALRILNLTLLRVQWLADLFRRVVVGRLMGARKAISLALRREVLFTDDGVRISDSIVSGNLPAEARDAALYRCRRVTGIHMASASYFQDQELEHAGGPWVVRVAENVTGDYADSSEIG